MGNCTSSCFIQVSDMAKVIDAQGKLRKVKLPVKAAEIMLDEPGRVISPVEELKRTRCVVPMRADDELLAAKAYVLVPIQRVNRKVTDVDVAIIEAACSGKKRAKSGAKVLPELREEERQVDPVLAVPGCRKGNYRPWTPVLEPISEVL
ncbi:hypothetical protein ERO13_D07G132400v2 [Gossypium hirsutum]|uniref:Uncharacterized protein n=5 Tax=Gossypium TaxID=3633 RepID=A0A1U8P591_GOSHI|nr:uncharacterized protein LOC107954360 [Gossypium hirsutum]KAG4138407.1 hypothetical protein ERO13_D07G132400v2 [Gossypium hirsutum]MBA0605054.1 hypothetical protein [Gossypium davidsonii]TYG61480.1 hypothetical protein ES288_D07G151700v1 [Gossypium darwinii]TYH62860.1 hypothetical protein ES332_D07G149300v1 [Gossypium tomentosum]